MGDRPLLCAEGRREGGREGERGKLYIGVMKQEGTRDFMCSMQLKKSKRVMERIENEEGRRRGNVEIDKKRDRKKRTKREVKVKRRTKKKETNCRVLGRVG